MLLYKRGVLSEMKEKMEHFPAKTPNPVISVAKNGKVICSNKAGEPLLYEWGVRVGEKLPSNIGYFVQRAISQTSSEKMEVKAWNRVYLISLHHLPEEECVNIYGFDISDWKELEEKLMENERYGAFFNTSAVGKVEIDLTGLSKYS